jgi:hypothetical protein
MATLVDLSRIVVDELEFCVLFTDVDETSRLASPITFA